MALWLLERLKQADNRKAEREAADKGQVTDLQKAANAAMAKEIDEKEKAKQNKS